MPSLPPSSPPHLINSDSMPFLTHDVDDEALSDDGGLSSLIRSGQNNSSADLPELLEDVNRAGHEVYHDLYSDEPPTHAENEDEDQDFVDIALQSEEAEVLVANDHATTSSDSTALTVALPSPLPAQQEPAQQSTPTQLPALPAFASSSHSLPLRIHVQTNYDPIAGRFYTDARMQQAGIPHLVDPHTSHLTTHIHELNFSDCELELVICTAFRTLVTLALLVDENAYACVIRWSPDQSSGLGVPRFSPTFQRWWFEIAVPSVHGFSGGRGGSDACSADDSGPVQGQDQQHHGPRFSWADVQALAGIFRHAPDEWGDFVDEREEEVRGCGGRRKRTFMETYAGGYMNEGIQFRTWD